MSLAPLSFFWLLVAVPIVACYLLKVRQRRVPVSTLMFWDRVYEEKPPRALWRQLRHLTSLLLQLLFLILVVAALSDPHFASEQQTQRRVVLILDNSASMNVADIGSSRLAEIKRRAADRIQHLRRGDQFAVLSASIQPTVVCGLTEHVGTLLQAVESIPATDGAAAILESVNLAERLIAGQSHQEIVVLSDGCFRGADEIAKRAADAESRDLDKAPVELVTVGKPATNTAITQFQVRRSLHDPLGYHVYIEVQHFGPDAINCSLELQLDDQLIDVLPLKLSSGGRWAQTIEKISEPGGIFTARLSVKDALPADNQAQAVLPERMRVPVSLVTRGHVFLQRVFEANPSVELSVSDSAPSADDLGTNHQRRVLVVHREIPTPFPTGNVLVLQPESSGSLWDVGERLEQPLVGKQQSDSPVLANVRLDNVLMPEARVLNFKVPHRVLIEAATGEPLLAEVTHPGGRVLVLTVSIERGDLPLRTAFPILMSNALNWFSGQGGEYQAAHAVGAVPEIRLDSILKSASAGEQVESLRVLSPTSLSRIVPLHRGSDETVSVGPLDQAGLWSLEPVRDGAVADASSGSESFRWACNLANAAESDLRAPAFGSTDNSQIARSSSRPLWMYLVVAAGVLTLLEWAGYQRRTVG